MELTRIKSLHPDQMGPLFLGGNLPGESPQSKPVRGSGSASSLTTSSTSVAQWKNNLSGRRLNLSQLRPAAHLGGVFFAATHCTLSLEADFFAGQEIGLARGPAEDGVTNQRGGPLRRNASR